MSGLYTNAFSIISFRKVWICWVVLSLCLLSSPGQADTSEALVKQMTSLDGIRGEIVQRVYAGGTLLEESTGHFALSKPNFRWQLDTPFPQTIVLRDSELQIYDADLAQLTIREIDVNSDESPATLLMQPERLLSGDYTVTVSADGERRVYALSPRGSSALFQMLEITFDAKVLLSLVIVDWQNQKTQIYFDNVEASAQLPSDLFILSVPAGTDVIRG